jgi:signal transduction histidine kinase
MRGLRLDLRLRIAAVLACVSIAVAGGLGITLYMASKELEEAMVKQLVSEELEFLVQRASKHGGDVSAIGPNLQHYVLRTPEEFEKLPRRLLGLGPGHHEIGRGSEESHVAVRDAGGVRFIVVYDSGAHEVREKRFQNLIVLLLGTVVAIVLVLGYGLAGVLTRQLTELAARVAVLAPDEPHPALERDGQDPEVAALAHALDNHHARIVEMMRREQEFAANTSHELRTPLTAIKTSCELLAADPGLSDKARTRIGTISRAAEQMTEQIQLLLFLARQPRAEGREPVALRDCVNEAADPYRDEMARKGLGFEVFVREDEVLEIERNALQTVLANLIMNAVRYTEGGYIRVTYEGRRLSVTDSGPGIAPRHLPHLFDRYYRAHSTSDGHGLGLAIVQRICDHLGWNVEVQSEPAVGSVFSIVFGGPEPGSRNPGTGENADERG